MDDKIIATNRSALRSKYGTKGVTALRNAVTNLIAADKKRGIKSREIYLDDAAAMKKLGGKAVSVSTDPGENKAAIDAVCKALSPDYLLILGATDVVPHQDLDNKTGDEDRVAWGDLPYACDEPYSRDPARFIGPTRVVGRLPDLVSATEPSYLVKLLKNAAAYRSRPKSDYENYFGLSAQVWALSTKLSLQNIFGSASDLLVSPHSGPKYPQGQLRALAHFINCHGAQASPEFYGQRGSSYPISLTSQSMSGEIGVGTIAAVECCYGAELYDSLTLATDSPICQTYLQQGAYGYLGSTTIAYGPADSNGAADLICQYFLRSILNGSSLGHAALQARQNYVANTGQMDPIDLKTLAQFCLLGDPSIHPVAEPKATRALLTVSVADSERFQRSERRTKLKLDGEFLLRTKPTVSKLVKKPSLSPNVKAALANISKRAGVTAGTEFATFSVTNATAANGRPGKEASSPSKYHLAISSPVRTVKNIPLGIAVVAKELDGRIVDYRIYNQR